ncbi:unnamed protein product [Sympodiomycopsis kandeliae]
MNIIHDRNPEECADMVAEARRILAVSANAVKEPATSRIRLSLEVWMRWIALVAFLGTDIFCRESEQSGLMKEGNDIVNKWVRRGSRYEVEQLLEFLERDQQRVKAFRAGDKIAKDTALRRQIDHFVKLVQERNAPMVYAFGCALESNIQAKNALIFSAAEAVCEKRWQTHTQLDAIMNTTCLQMVEANEETGTYTILAKLFQGQMTLDEFKTSHVMPHSEMDPAI